MEGGTGVFYQVMPAVGPDGKNVMKLIPVQKVNGQFIHMPTSTSSSIYGLGSQTTLSHPVRITPPSVSQNRIPVVEPTADGKFILKGPTNTNSRLTKNGQQANPPKVLVGQVRLPVVPKRTQSLVSCPVNASGMAAASSNTSQLPVTVSSPRLPNGHYLQIPPDAKVQTLPTSALPQSIKKRILNLPHDMASTEKPSTVVYVSPVNSMKIDTSKLKDSASPISKCITANIPKDNSTCSRSIPTQSPKAFDSDHTTPMKWVVQQKDKSSAPCLVPATPNCMASEILKAVAQMEKSSPSKSQNTSSLLSSCISSSSSSSSTSTSPASSQQNQTKISPNKDNALVMCNGKVYFVTNKDSGLCLSNNESHTPAKDGSSPRKSTQSPGSFSVSHTSGTTKHSPQPICIDVDPDEVIDLCDDDPQTEGTSVNMVKNKAGAPTEEEDDTNVIFVSYIPPKTCAKDNTKGASSETGEDQLDQPMPVKGDCEQAKKVHSKHENYDSDKQTGSNLDKINAESVSGIKDSVDLKNSEPVSRIKDRVDMRNAEPVFGIEDSVDLSAEDCKPDKTVSVCDVAQTPANSEAETSSISNESDNLSESNGENVADRVHLDTTSSTVPIESLVSDVAQSSVSEEARPGTGVLQEEPSNVKDAVQETSQDTSQEQRLTVPVNVLVKEADQQSQHHYDCKIRQLFGITKDIKIYLKRCHSEKRDTPSETRSINKRTLEGIRRLIQGSQMEIKAKKLIEAQVHLAKDVKRRKVEPSREMAEKPNQSEVSVWPHVSPTCGLFDNFQRKINTLTTDTVTQKTVPSGCSGESTILPGLGLDTTKDTDMVSSTDADRLAPEASATRLQETSLEPWPSIAGSCNSHNPISTKTVTSGKSNLCPEEDLTETEESSYVESEPSHSACEDAGSTPDALKKDLFSTEAMEPEEIQRCEKIKRLKELLKEKEAALEAMRKKMSM